DEVRVAELRLMHSPNLGQGFHLPRRHCPVTRFAQTESIRRRRESPLFQDRLLSYWVSFGAIASFAGAAPTTGRKAFTIAFASASKASASNFSSSPRMTAQYSGVGTRDGPDGFSRSK